jgi:hypothetical protein
MMRPEKVALMDGTESLIISSFNPCLNTVRYKTSTSLMRTSFKPLATPPKLSPSLYRSLRYLTRFDI